MSILGVENAARRVDDVVCFYNHGGTGHNNESTLLQCLLGHFRVAVNLIMKARPSAKLFI